MLTSAAGSHAPGVHLQTALRHTPRVIAVFIHKPSFFLSAFGIRNELLHPIVHHELLFADTGGSGHTQRSIGNAAPANTCAPLGLDE
jgi:hypothetical protein